MAIGDNGQGIWENSTTPKTTPSNPNGGKNALSQVGSNATNVSAFNGGSASGGPSGGLSPDQGSGPANQPSPDASMLSTIGKLSPDQGNGPPNQPSPDQSLLSTVGKSGNGASETTRQPYLGGVEKGVQVQ